MRETRLWQDPQAHIQEFSGDIVSCLLWYAWAKTKLRFMLHAVPGSTSQVFVPTADVMITIYTRPNRIRIQAGVSPFMIQGYLTNALGTMVKPSTFVVYNGKQPDRFLNPIPVSTTLVTALSELDNLGNPKPTFLRKRKLTDKSAILFGGYANPISRIYKTSAVPDGLGGILSYDGVDYDTGYHSIMDATVINGQIYALAYSQGSSYRSVALVKMDWATLQFNELFYVVIRTSLADANYRYGFTVKIWVDGAERSLIDADQTMLGTPAGAASVQRSSRGAPVWAILDARFSADNSTVSILAGMIDDTLGMNTLIGAYDPADPSKNGESSRNYFSVVDIVVRTDLVEYIPAIEATNNAFLENTTDKPITYKLYKHQCAYIEHKYLTSIQKHSDYRKELAQGSYISYIYLVGNNRWIVYGGSEGGRAWTVRLNSAGVYITDSTDIDPYFALYIYSYSGTEDPIPSSALSFAWTAAPTLTWTRPGASSPYGQEAWIGELSRPWTVTINCADPFWGSSSTNVNTYTGTHTNPYYVEDLFHQEFQATLGDELRATGTVYIGYSFDMDKKSPAYGRREFVELGFKKELQSPVNSKTSLNLTANVSVSEYQRFGYGRPAGHEGNVWDDSVLPPVPPHWEEYKFNLNVASGGFFALSIYVGDTVVTRCNWFFGYNKGQKLDWEYLQPMSFAWWVRGVTQYATGQTLNFDQIPAASPEAYPLGLPISPARIDPDESVSILPIYVGGVDYDELIGCYTTYGIGPTPSGSQIPTGMESVNPDAWDSLLLPKNARQTCTMKAAVFNGKDHFYDVLTETIAGTPPSAADYQQSIPTSTRVVNVGPFVFSGDANSVDRKAWITLAKYNCFVHNTGYFVGDEYHGFNMAVNTTPFTIDSYIKLYGPSTGGVFRDPMTKHIIVGSTAYEPSAATSTVTADMPTKSNQFVRDGIYVFAPDGTLVSSTLTMPDGTNQSAHPNEWRRRMVTGYAAL